jgi:hypothetical protein
VCDQTSGVYNSDRVALQWEGVMRDYISQARASLHHSKDTPDAQEKLAHLIMAVESLINAMDRVLPIQPASQPSS